MLKVEHNRRTFILPPPSRLNMVVVESESGWRQIDLSNGAGRKVKASIIIDWWHFESGAKFKVNMP